MSISEPRPGERVKAARVDDHSLAVDPYEGRTLIVPLAWFPRLMHATPEQRAKFRVSGGGFGLHWPDIDEDLSVEGLLHGVPVPRR